MARTNPAIRVRGAVLELKDAVRELIESAPAENIERVFEAVYWERSSMSVRAARLGIFNGIVAILAADLRAQQRAASRKTRQV